MERGGNEVARPPRVPLEAGIGPDNPPCPACGEPLFGWAKLRPEGTPVRRCENCGLGVSGALALPPEAAAAVARLGPGASGLPNRDSLQAAIGGSGWAGLEPGRRFLFTPASLRRLGIAEVRTAAAAAGMWQTLLNSFTFGHNVALGRLGRAAATPADRRWQRRMDAVISILATPIVLVVAAVLEGAAALLGRGGRLKLGRR